jgi:hypothetical protein
MESFPRALQQLDPRVRKLLLDWGIHTDIDLSTLDPWKLIHERGVGRATVRALVDFMTERGVELRPAPFASRRPIKLVVSFPHDLAERVHKEAAAQKITPAALVMKLVSDALGKED